MPDTSVLQAFIIAAVLTVDTFVVSFSLAVNKVKVPFLSAAVISLLSTLVLGVGMLAGKSLSVYIPKNIAAFICHATLIAIGLYKTLEAIFRRNRSVLKTLCPVQNCNVLKTVQSISLGLALSLDSLAAGIGIGAGGGLFFWYIDFSLLLGITFIYVGALLGHKLTAQTSINFSWLSGAALILVGISGLI